MMPSALLAVRLTNGQSQINLEGLENGINFIRLISESSKRLFTSDTSWRGTRKPSEINLRRFRIKLLNLNS